MQLARNLAVEWGRSNVRVNTIAPGLVRTDMARALWEDPDRLAQALESYPLGRASANPRTSPAPPSSWPREPATS